MKILVTGTEGYIGCRLAPILLADGHDVIGLDTGYYRDGHLFSSPSATRRLPALIRRTCGSSNPLTSRALTRSSTSRSCPTTRWARTIPSSPIASTTWVRCAWRSSRSRPAYGASSTRRRAACTASARASSSPRTSPINPQTAYAKCKTLVERDVGTMAVEGLQRHLPAQRDRLRRRRRACASTSC